MSDDDEDDSCLHAICPDCWTDGCGLDDTFDSIADGISVITPLIECFASAICACGSPIAFPLIFCFSPDPHTNETSGWAISMLRAPTRRPCSCCLMTICLPCGQWELRRRVLDGDFSRYKLWQGYHDGPHCFAVVCPSAPITIEAGTYGEQDCPKFFLCLEVCCLGGMFSSCCAFDVSRDMMKDEWGLETDPTEARQEKCADFFGSIMETISNVACCMGCCGTMVGCCAPDSEGAQEFEDEAKGCARALWKIARAIHDGIWSVKIIAIGCMSAQMIHQHSLGERNEEMKRLEPPTSNEMQRDDDDDDDDDDDEDEEIELKKSNDKK